jgi:hypothetical protein
MIDRALVNDFDPFVTATDIQPEPDSKVSW